MHLQPVFAGARAYTDGTSKWLFGQGISMPSGSALTDDQKSRITETVTTYLSRVHA